MRRNIILSIILLLASGLCLGQFPVSAIENGSTGYVVCAGASIPYWFDLFGTANTWTAVQYLTQTSTGNILTMTSTDAGAVGALMEFYQNSASPASGDDLGTITFFGQDSNGGDKVQFASFRGAIYDPDFADPGGGLEFSINLGGTMRQVLSLYAYVAETPILKLETIDLGNDNYGPMIIIGRNSNPSNANSGTLSYYDYDGTQYFLWVDNSGNYRIADTPPNGATSDTYGTVVGAQTSWHALKENIQPTSPEDYNAALEAVLRTPLYWYNLKADHEQKRRMGLVIYDQDRGGWFSYNDQTPGAIPSLDERNLFGYYAGAIKALNARVEALEKQRPL